MQVKGTFLEHEAGAFAPKLHWIDSRGKTTLTIPAIVETVQITIQHQSLNFDTMVSFPASAKKGQILNLPVGKIDLTLEGLDTLGYAVYRADTVLDIKKNIIDTPLVKIYEKVPLAPLNLNATALSRNSIRLSWSDRSTNEDHFLLFRLRETDSSFILRDSILANVMTFMDTGLSQGTIYKYKIQAKNSAGVTVFSNTAEETTLANTPPQILSKISNFKDSLVVNRLYRDTVSFMDADNDPLRLSVLREGNESLSVINDSIFNIQPDISDTGQSSLFISIKDSYGALDTLRLNMTVYESIPQPPLNLSLVSIDSSTAESARISWTDKSDIELGYQIRWTRLTDTTDTQIDSVNQNTTSFNLERLIPNRPYRVILRAFNYTRQSDTDTLDFWTPAAKGLQQLLAGTSPAVVRFGITALESIYTSVAIQSNLPASHTLYNWALLMDPADPQIQKYHLLSSLKESPPASNQYSSAIQTTLNYLASFQGLSVQELMVSVEKKIESDSLPTTLLYLARPGGHLKTLRWILQEAPDTLTKKGQSIVVRCSTDFVIAIDHCNLAKTGGFSTHGKHVSNALYGNRNAIGAYLPAGDMTGDPNGPIRYFQMIDQFLSDSIGPHFLTGDSLRPHLDSLLTLLDTLNSRLFLVHEKVENVIAALSQSAADIIIDNDVLPRLTAMLTNTHDSSQRPFYETGIAGFPAVFRPLLRFYMSSQK